MWRIYSAEKTGIRLRSTIRKALAGLNAWTGEKANHQAYIGRVKYLSSRKLKSFATNAIRMPLNASDFASTLLVKRLAFKHENEIRVLFLADASDLIDKGTFRYKVDPNAMVEQMMVDPRLTPKEATDLVSSIRRETEFRGPILRSLLYATPKGFSFPINPA